MDNLDLDLIAFLITILILIFKVTVFVFVFWFGLLLLGGLHTSLSGIVLLGLDHKLTEITEPLFGHSFWEDSNTVTMEPLVTVIAIEHEAIVVATLTHAS